ncbi:MAG: porin family protein [Mesorhizobium amorphae]|nr:MAG: porin family protein [Mesorhizobium amorphae]
MTSSTFERSRLLRSAALAAGLAFVASAPAFAADVVMEEPPAPLPIEELPVASWAGPYVGLQLGYGFGDAQSDATGAQTDADGVIGGAFAGYNWESNNVVYGVEGDIGYGDRKGDDQGLSAESRLEGSLRARLGYAVTPDLLVYGTAGGAAQNLKVTEAGSGEDKGLVGYTVGAGTDIKFTQNVFGRVEYRYTDYGKESFNTGIGNSEYDAKDHRVQFGIGMSF